MPYSRSGINTPAVPVLVQDEGVDLTRRQTLNFVGAGVTAADSGGKTRIASTPPYIDGRDYVVANGSDELTGARAAVTAANTVNGTVVWPAGTIGISGYLQSAGTSWRGQGADQNQTGGTIFKCLAYQSGVSIEGDGAIHMNYAVDGNSTAGSPLQRSDGMSGMTAINLQSKGAVDQCLYYAYSQNDLWLGCEFHSSASYGMKMINGFGGCKFIRCESRNHINSCLYITEVAGDGGYSVPTHNAFDHCIFEDTSGLYPVVYFEIGQSIVFNDCGFVHSNGSYTGGLVEGFSGVNQGPVTFRDCFWAGTSNSNGQSGIHVPDLAENWAITGQSKFQFVQYAVHAPTGQCQWTGSRKLIACGAAISPSTAAANVGDMGGGPGGIARIPGNFEVDGNFGHYGSNLAFFNATTTTKKTVTGSRGGNAALASLLTALADYGLITDSTSA